MAITTYYRGVAFIKDYFVHYFNSIFFAAQKGQILLTNGFKEIKFSDRPHVLRRASWDFNKLPAVLIGAVRANYKYMSIAKDYLNEAGATSTDQYRYYGGDINSTMDIEVRARTIDERDNLVDITCLFLAHPDAKDFFDKHAIVLKAPPSVGSEKDIFEPKIDHPIYGTSLSIDLVSPWMIKIPITEYRLIDVIADLDITMPVDFDSGT